MKASPGRDEAALVVDSLCAGYGRMSVVKDLSLVLGQGESVAVLGPNGHGKTTALRAVAGLGKTSKGSVTLHGQDVTGFPAHEVSRRGLVYMPQGSPLFPRLSVEQNLVLASRSARARPKREENLGRVVQLFPKLESRKRQKVGSLSGGERQMVAIAMGLMASPSVLMLDEPTLGLAPKVRGEIIAALFEIRSSGLSMVLVDGDVDFLFDATDRWYVVEGGRVVGSGSAAERPSRSAVMDMYVGAGPESARSLLDSVEHNQEER